jgi:hypothetical protein
MPRTPTALCAHYSSAKQISIICRNEAIHKPYFIGSVRGRHFPKDLADLKPNSLVNGTGNKFGGTGNIGAGTGTGVPGPSDE